MTNLPKSIYLVPLATTNIHPVHWNGVVKIATGCNSHFTKILMSSGRRIFTHFLLERVMLQGLLYTNSMKSRINASNLNVWCQNINMRQNRRNTWTKGRILSKIKENLQLQGLGGQLVLFDEIPCPFCFRVYWDDNSGRWLLPHKQKGNLNHCGLVPNYPVTRYRKINYFR